jgi:hypothetical protein
VKYRWNLYSVVCFKVLTAERVSGIGGWDVMVNDSSEIS